MVYVYIPYIRNIRPDSRVEILGAFIKKSDARTTLNHKIGLWAFAEIIFREKDDHQHIKEWYNFEERFKKCESVQDIQKEFKKEIEYDEILPDVYELENEDFIEFGIDHFEIKTSPDPFR